MMQCSGTGRRWRRRAAWLFVFLLTPCAAYGGEAAQQVQAAERTDVPSVEAVMKKWKECRGKKDGYKRFDAYLRALAPDVQRTLFDRLMKNRDEDKKRHLSSWIIRRFVDVIAEGILEKRVARFRTNRGAPPPLRSAPEYTVLTYPKTDGSTSTIPLERVIACRLLHAPYRWVVNPLDRERAERRLHMDGGFAFEMPYTYNYIMAKCGVVAMGESEEKRRLGIIINHLLVRHRGTHGSYVSLIDGTADLILAARAPSPDEIERAKKKGVRLDAVPVALDAFVFIVNRLNPVTNLTDDQVRNIYAGRITKWAEVGGKEGEIHAYQRNENSGSQQLMLTLVMRGEPIYTGGNAWRKRMIGMSMMGAFHKVNEDSHSLGYSVFYYERHMTVSLESRMIAINGVHPDAESIAARRYPYVSEVYAVIREDAPADSRARKLRDWLLTEEGQSVVAESGYVPIREAGD